MRIIYMGTPEFAVEALDRIAKAGHEVVLVVTQPDKPKNRGKKLQPTPVKEKALDLGIEVVQPEKVKGNAEFLEKIKSVEAELAVVAAYGQILPEEVLEAPKYGCVNIHASLLPFLRGAAPIQRAIIEGYAYTGVTLMKMDKGMDTGNIITKRMTGLNGVTGGELHDELMDMGGEMIVELLAKVEAEGPDVLKGTPQDHEKATYAPMLKKSEGLIDFDTPADDICLKINGMDPWPSAYTTYKGETVKLRNPEWYGTARPSEDQEPGTIMKVSKEGMLVKCRGSLVMIHTIQFPNKKSMSVGEYIKGNSLEEGVVLGK